MSDEYIPAAVADVFEGEIEVPCCYAGDPKPSEAEPPAKKQKPAADDGVPEGYRRVNEDYPGDRNRLWFELSEAQINRAMEDPWKHLYDRKG